MPVFRIMAAPHPAQRATEASIVGPFTFRGAGDLGRAGSQNGLYAIERFFVDDGRYGELYPLEMGPFERVGVIGFDFTMANHSHIA